MIDFETPKKILDLDDINTWSDAVTSYVSDQSRIFNLGKDPYMKSGNEKLSELLESTLVLTYHATRLLPHERVDIAANGLDCLSEKLVERKIREAIAHKYLSSEIGNELYEGSALRTRASEQRNNQICLVLGKSALIKNTSSVRPLLEIWGGESINFTRAGEKYRSVLEEIGQPAVVKVALPITHRSLLNGARLLNLTFIMGFQRRSPIGSINWRNGSIPARYILDIMNPEELR